MKYQTVAIAGTFDRLHKGHRFFISEAFKLGERVIIGLTSDSFVKKKLEVRSKKLEEKVKNYNDRKEELEGVLREKDYLKRAEIIKIDDVYGPTLKQSDIEALVVTEETLAGAIKVNKRRRELGLRKLDIVEVPLIKAEDSERISSTRIRLGEIDRWGKVYGRLPVYGSRIAEAVRMKLKKPLGILIRGKREALSLPTGQAGVKREVLKYIAEKPVCIITVGDEATHFLNKLGRQADIAVIDFHIKRIRVHESLRDLKFPAGFWREKYKNKIVKTKNPAGHITTELVETVKTVLKEYISDGKKRVIEVEGEEDLAGVPAILLAPLDSLVLYGQPDDGVVAVEVTEEKKQEIMEIVLTKTG